jgi:Tfp pilus assembly protein PilO
MIAALDRTEEPEGYWRQWVQPPTVITLIVAASTVYGAQVIQSERLETMRAKVEAIERDYSRQDTLALELRNIYRQLDDIKNRLDVDLARGEKR